MTPEEANLITGLFQRLRSADTAAKDSEAQQLIESQMAAFPSAPYLLIQTVLVQEHALQNAQARIAALERQIVDASGSRFDQGGGKPSFLSGLFGSHPSAPTQPAPQAPPPLPAAPTASLPASAGGGFLKGALTTAAGVAGGALLFQGIQDLLGHQAGAFGGPGGIAEVPENVEIVNNYFGDDPNQDPNLAPDDAQDNQMLADDWSQDQGSDDFSGGDNIV